MDLPETPQRGIDFAVAGRGAAQPEENRAYFLAVTRMISARSRRASWTAASSRDRDRKGSPLVVLVSRGLAGRLFPNDSAVGKRLKLNPDKSEDWREIVGVVDNIRYSGLDDPGGAAIYTPFSQTPFLWTYAMVRTSVPPESLFAAARECVRREGLTAARLRPMEAIVSGSVAQPRFQALLLGIRGAGARARGRRKSTASSPTESASGGRRSGSVALGAAPFDVLRLIGGQGTALFGAGLVAGIVAAAGAGRLMQTQVQGLLFETRQTRSRSRRSRFFSRPSGSSHAGYRRAGPEPPSHLPL